MKKLLQCSASVNCQPLGDPGFAFPFLARDDDDVQSVRSSSLQPHGLQHARLPCPSLSSRVFSNSCPLGRWWHPTISSSIVPYPLAFNLSQHQSLPVSQLFASGGQNIGTSALASVLSMNIQGFPLGLTGLISLQSKGLSRVFSSSTVRKHQFFSTQPSLWLNSPICSWLLEKTITFTNTDFCWQSDVSAF